MKLLIAEDDKKLLKTLKHIFITNGYLADGVSNGEDAYAYALSGEYDGFVFDIMMPGMDGLTVLRKLRDKNISSPALFLTARTQTEQKVEGLDAGADDYIAKPFSTAELLARVRAMLRRKEAYLADSLCCGDLKLDRSCYQLHCQDETQVLSGKEFQVMEMLMQSPGQIIPIEQFITHIWGWDAEVESSVMWVHVSNIRKKLAAIHSRVEIQFVRGAGYRLEAAQ